MSNKQIDFDDCPHRSGLEARLDGLVASMETMDEHITAALNRLDTRVENVYNTFHNRLPIWATVIIMLLMGACGWLLKIAFGD